MLYNRKYNYTYKQQNTIIMTTTWMASTQNTIPYNSMNKSGLIDTNHPITTTINSSNLTHNTHQNQSIQTGLIPHCTVLSSQLRVQSFGQRWNTQFHLITDLYTHPTTSLTAYMWCTAMWWYSTAHHIPTSSHLIVAAPQITKQITTNQLTAHHYTNLPIK